VAKTYKGNYTDFLRQKEEDIVKQWTAFEKWNKEVAKQKDIIRRCATDCLLAPCMLHPFAMQA
jgi:ATPase subunit of ABC transporter with duplicated ATPase domains